MEKQVILNIHNHPIVTNLFISTRNSRRRDIAGGEVGDRETALISAPTFELLPF